MLLKKHIELSQKQITRLESRVHEAHLARFELATP